MEKTTDRLISLESVYNNPTFPAFGRPCDTHLYTDDGTEFKIYSEFLSKHSEFFKSLFSISEEIGQNVVIHGIESNIMKRILYYLYTGHFSLNTKNMLQLLIASDFLMIEPLKLICQSFVLQHINQGNCISIFLTAYQIQGLGMKDECQRFLLLCFEKAVHLSGEEAYNLPYDSVKYFLSRLINVSDERFIWSYIEEWVKTDAFNRMSVVPELLRYLCVSDIDDKLASFIITSPIILQNELYKGLGDPQVTLHHFTDKQKVWGIINHRSELPFFTGSRLPKSVYFIIKCSLEDNDDVQMFLSYNQHFDLWRRVSSSNFILHQVLRVDHRVFIFKTNTDLRSDGESCIYDLLTNTSMPIAPIPGMRPGTRDNIFLVETAGHIYALGSYFFFPKVFQQYIYETDEWISLRSMIKKVALNAALSLNGLIYISGIDDNTEQATMLVYNPSLRPLRRWKILSPPNTRRLYVGSVVYQGKIFLIGGLNEISFNEPSRDVEVYDPVTDVWVFYPEVPFDNDDVYAGYAVLKEKVFVYRRREPYSVAYWDGSGEWKIVDDQSPLQDMFQYSFLLIEEEDIVRKILKANRGVAPSRWEDTGLGREMLLKSYD